MMKNLLFISVYPFPMDMGSKQHALFFLKALAKKYYVHCVFFLAPRTETPIEKDALLTETGIRSQAFCRFENDRSKRKYLRFMKDLFAFPNNFVNSATHATGLATIQSIIDEHAIDVVHIEHFWFAKYAFKLRKSLKKVVVYHDLHHNVFKQYAKAEKKFHRKLFFWVECLKFYAFEKKLDRRVTQKIFLNPLELKAFPKKSVHIPHIVNSEIKFKPARKTDRINILFMGGYNHQPNRESFEFIVNDIIPSLVQRKNDFHVNVVGSNTDKFVPLIEKSKLNSYFSICGFVSDINLAFDAMDIALFPIMSGGGIKTKILDAMASGVPVVTTPEGITGLYGLPANCISVGRTAEELTDALCELMTDHEKRVIISNIGRQFIDDKHSFTALTKDVDRLYLAESDTQRYVDGRFIKSVNTER